MGEIGAETASQVMASTLIQAIPYILRFRGKVLVVKYGGNAMVDPELVSSFAQDIALLSLVGMKPVVVHGGGPMVSERMRQAGLEPRFLGGLRVTDEQTMELVRMVLVGLVNKDVVSAISRAGAVALGLSGEDGGLVVARPAGPPELGLVGEVEAVDPGVLLRLLEEGIVPVLASVARDEKGRTLNINADTMAGAVARSLQAEKLVYLTNVAGLYEGLGEGGRLISRLDAAELEGLLARGVFSEGMIPKVQGCLEALRGGVRSAHILDGRVKHALLLEVFTDHGVGTMVVP